MDQVRKKMEMKWKPVRLRLQRPLYGMNNCQSHFEVSLRFRIKQVYKIATVN